MSTDARVDGAIFPALPRNCRRFECRLSQASDFISMLIAHGIWSNMSRAGSPGRQWTPNFVMPRQ